MRRVGIDFGKIRWMAGSVSWWMCRCHSIGIILICISWPGILVCSTLRIVSRNDCTLNNEISQENFCKKKDEKRLTVLLKHAILLSLLFCKKVMLVMMTIQLLITLLGQCPKKWLVRLMSIYHMWSILTWMTKTTWSLLEHMGVSSSSDWVAMGDESSSWSKTKKSWIMKHMISIKQDIYLKNTSLIRAQVNKAL